MRKKYSKIRASAMSRRRRSVKANGFADAWTNDIFRKGLPSGVREILVYFRNGRNAKYTSRLFNEFISDSAVDQILDAETGEVLFDRASGVGASKKSVKCATKGRRSIKAASDSGVMIKTETAEGTYYLAKSATKKKTFWTESYDSANKFAKKDSALNKLYSVLSRLEDNAFYDPDDMYDIESEADLKKAKFAKFYITDLSGKTIEDISTEVKNHLLADDAFVSAVLDDFDDEDDIEESTRIRGRRSVKCSTRRRRTIKASVGDEVYADDIKDIIRNAGIKVWEVKKYRTHNSDSFFSILLDNTNDFNAVVDAITDAGYGVTYDYPAVDGNYMYIMISDNREDDAFLYRVVYGYQSEVVPMDDETSDYQAVLDECIDMKEARGDKDLYTYDEIEEEGWNEDEYVTGGNRGLALYTGGNFMIEPIGRGKLSEYVGSSTKVTAARRIGRKILASAYDGSDIVMFFNNKEIYRGQPGSYMYDAIYDLCKNDSVRMKFQKWLEQYGDSAFSDEPGYEYGDAGETAVEFCEFVYYAFADGEDYLDGEGILNFEIFPESDEAEIFNEYGDVESSTKVTAARDTTVDKDAVRELVLYITNDASLYPQVQAIVKNMKQKIKRGKYDDELAVKAWQYLADAGVAKYDREFGSGGGTKAMLNKATREQIARELRDEYADMVNEDVEASEGLVTM